jgi:hypothetical protein
MRILGEGTVKKTRRPHRCGVCGKIIPPGESAQWQTNTGGDWDFGTVYLHPECDIDIDIDF